jgi:hypothetical protein
MKNMPQKIWLLSLVLLVSLTYVSGPSAASSGVPMPYTEEAVTRLNGAIEKMKAPVLTDEPGENDINVKSYIASYRQIFAAAGYDYERSLIKIINDIQFDRYRLNRATIKLNGLARELLRLHVNTGVNPKKYLSKDCAEILIEFRALIRSNMKKYGGC